ncbi:Yip1-like protein [Caldicellulosiruptor bescii]|uniref:Yip1 domain-containing protein n=2 Tax=Caldicellulosiruptor bescii TaxID=31899 RepID=B9MLQ8_CALBD|nr:YIP1 family protein [Caldicellulosiruptor bescii]ACM59266.1 conserved hypothetical protein [Caldicellulosiruptor bescii DSM 6725]PBC88277.1 Yip1-like protein [Caldicellulosiruptor bescii]PBC92242.1 Yip1-like protein [Caldicellulosiruptor bescii]PBD04949.1 Yip1-like protein [Caldicellulosiruptor bescii]PBD05421.1 Yip1-like protein [Caldicellulosiruptor bescii]
MEVLKPKNLLYLIIRPSRVFEIVKEKGVFLEQFLLYVIATFVYQLILPSPSKEQIESWVRENMKNPPTQNLEMTVKTMQFSLSPAVRAFSSLFGAGLVIVIFSLVVLVIVKILKGNINFKKSFALVSTAILITILQYILHIAIFLITHKSPVDFLAAKDTSFAQVLAKTFNIFEIWYLVLLGIGVYVVAGLSKAKSVICSLVVAVINLLLAGISLLVGKV